MTRARSGLYITMPTLAILLLASSTLAIPESSEEGTATARLRAVSRALLQSSEDLLNLASTGQQNEQEVARDMKDLAAVALSCSDRLDVAAEFVSIRDQMRDRTDRELVDLLLKSRVPVDQVRFTIDLKKIDLYVKKIELYHEIRNKPAIATAAARIRDALREGQSLLESIKK